MTTIGKLSRRYGLSRTTLLYYDKVGVLKPSARSENGYRVYTDADAARLERICLYRRAGLSLKAIKAVLEPGAATLNHVLDRRLTALATEIADLRTQQHLVLALLPREPPENLGVLDKAGWCELLAASGFSDADMRAWHVAFERHAPRKHQAFLAFLGIPAREIAEIRCWSKSENTRERKDKVA